MTDEAKGQTEGKVEDPIYAPANTATAYADYVSNLHYNSEVARFFIVRDDPSVNAKGPMVPNVVAQVIMPTSGFIGTSLFFMRMITNMRASGYVSKDTIDRIDEWAQEWLSSDSDNDHK